MSKFDKQIEKVNSLKVKTVEQYMDILTSLEEMREPISEGVAYYAKRELLNDHNQESYTNARKYWEHRLDLVDDALKIIKSKANDVKNAPMLKEIEDASVKTTA